ncbi:MAG: glycosyltransferase family 4 protein, partial [Bacteroidales bacterium]|nr:glycosyltransferase family 4 protein [Bacteroidales bacterium]
YHLRNLQLCLAGTDWRDWGCEFQGEIVRFNHPKELLLNEGEIVIALGTFAVPLLAECNQPGIKKLRFCHGFAADKPKLMADVWGGDLPIITVSNTLVPKLEKYSGREILGVVPNGIRTDLYYTEERKRDGIGMVFGTHYNKDPETALGVLDLVMKHRPDVPLYIFGESRCPKGIPAQYYYRYPSVDKARELYNRSLLWLIPSRAEGLPGPPLEAMACGTVVLTTNNLGSMEIVRHKENGWVVPIGDKKAFMESIELLLDDDATRKELVQEGYNTVKYFSWDRAVDCMVDVLERLNEGA